jgi:2-polyprenyl-3-methyl-5-hydroxy-6-metoxy-1,4-benzoquinol methylase
MPITLQQTVTACPLCGSERNTIFDQRVSHGYAITNRLCQSCGLVFLSPRMSEGQLSQFYAENYRSLYHIAKEPTPTDLEVQTIRANHLLDILRRQGLAHLKSHLDIGCSTGTLLNTFKSHFNNNTIGIELDEAHRAYAQDHGINAYPTLSDLPGEYEKQFDLVSLIHVLEHLPDPLGTLVDLRSRWMAWDGWLILEVPNLYCHDSFEVAHLTSFSPATLSIMAERAGFKVVKLIKHGQPRSDVLPIYMTLLARPNPNPQAYPQPARREMGIRFKREAGLAYRRVITRLLPGRAWKAV